MTWMSRRWRRLLLRVLTVSVAVPWFFSGCKPFIHPEPPAFPPAPPVDCPPVRVYSAESTPETPAQSHQSFQPIDLVTALRLADSQNPEIAVARERIREALAIQDRAELLCIPDLEIGSTWVR